MDDDSAPEFVASECSHPLTREDRRTLRRIIGRPTLAVLIFLVVLLALNAIAASMGYGSFWPGIRKHALLTAPGTTSIS